MFKSRGLPVVVEVIMSQAINKTVYTNAHPMHSIPVSYTHLDVYKRQVWSW